MAHNIGLYNAPAPSPAFCKTFCLASSRPQSDPSLSPTPLLPMGHMDLAATWP